MSPTIKGKILLKLTFFDVYLPFNPYFTVLYLKSFSLFDIAKRWFESHPMSRNFIKHTDVHITIVKNITLVKKSFFVDEDFEIKKLYPLFI